MEHTLSLPIAYSSELSTAGLAETSTIGDYIQAATSDNTRRAYQSDIRHFMEWGGILPASTEIILHYLQQHAIQLNPRTLVRRLTGLKQWHVCQGFTDPTAHPLVRKTLKGIQYKQGIPKEKASPLTLEILQQLVIFLRQSQRLIEARNNALLQIGFFGAFRRSELVAIQWEHIHWVPEGVEIMIPRSKTDQIGEGQICAIPYGDDLLCPVNALKQWCESANIASGAIFRRVTKDNHLQEQAITAQQWNAIFKSMIRAAGLPDPDSYSSHSLRRGFASTASKKGAPFGAIMQQGRWRHEGTVLGYIEEGKRFDSNAALHILKSQAEKNDQST
jgi:integrase